MVWARTGSKLPQGMTPSIIRANKGAGGGSFSTLPLILRDQTLTFEGGAPNDGGFRFQASDSTMYQNGGGALASVDSTPLQYHSNRPASSSGFAVRHTAIFNSNVTAFVFDFPTIDVWNDFSIAPFDMVRPSFGTTEGFTATIEMATQADHSTILARANIRYEWSWTI